jgi:hypothetical protein
MKVSPVSYQKNRNENFHMKLYLRKGAESGYALENIAHLAREMKAETEASELPPDWLLDPGFYASFWKYPVAEALS